MTVSFITLAVKHYEAAMELWNSLPGVRAQESRSEFVRILERNPELSTAVLDEDRIIGAVLCCHDGRRGYLYHLGIAQSHQRMGIGKQLIDRSLRLLEAAGISRCSVFVIADNHEGLRFWESQNWRERSDLRVFAMDLEPVR